GCGARGRGLYGAQRGGGQAVGEERIGLFSWEARDVSSCIKSGNRNSQAGISQAGQLPVGRARCPLWVKSGHMRCKRPCPLYPRKRHQTRHMECPLRANSGQSAKRNVRKARWISDGGGRISTRSPPRVVLCPSFKPKSPLSGIGATGALRVSEWLITKLECG